MVAVQSKIVLRSACALRSARCVCLKHARFCAMKGGAYRFLIGTAANVFLPSSNLSPDGNCIIVPAISTGEDSVVFDASIAVTRSGLSRVNLSWSYGSAEAEREGPMLVLDAELPAFSVRLSSIQAHVSSFEARTSAGAEDNMPPTRASVAAREA